ncbi:MAG: RedB protein [Vicinamibacterales bacterium]
MQKTLWISVAATVWLACVVAGLSVVWSYENGAGVAATPSAQWPAASRLVPASDRPTLVFVAHPQCTCTRASLGELAEALARTATPPRTYVVFIKPSSMPDGWEKSGLWSAAGHLPNTTIVRDDDGREAESFGAATSGQTFVYDAAGTLQFSGGITASRAHAGDNDGRASVVALLNRLEKKRASTNVYGCSLFASAKS